MAESSSSVVPGDVEWLPGPGGTRLLRIHPPSPEPPVLILRVAGGEETRLEAGPGPHTEYEIPGELDWDAAWLVWPDGSRAAIPAPHGREAQVIELRPTALPPVRRSPPPAGRATRHAGRRARPRGRARFVRPAPATPRRPTPRCAARRDARRLRPPAILAGRAARFVAGRPRSSPATGRSIVDRAARRRRPAATPRRPHALAGCRGPAPSPRLRPRAPRRRLAPRGPRDRRGSLRRSSRRVRSSRATGRSVRRRSSASSRRPPRRSRGPARASGSRATPCSRR